jgi:hypothetical protein
MQQLQEISPGLHKTKRKHNSPEPEGKLGSKNAVWTIST